MNDGFDRGIDLASRLVLISKGRAGRNRRSKGARRNVDGEQKKSFGDDELWKRGDWRWQQK